MAIFLADYPPTLGNEAKAGQHYMIIDSYESTSAISRSPVKLSSIGLYIPAGSLKTTHTGNYEGKAGAATAATGGSALMDTLQSLMGGGGSHRPDGTGGADGDFDLSGAVTKGMAAIKMKGSQMLAGALDTGGFVSASGKSPNNYMAMVYGGPKDFRNHSFEFKFFPRNTTESSTVKQIIGEFERGTLPRMAGFTGGGTGDTLTDPFFKSPRQHEITFYKGGSGSAGAGSENVFLFKIGTSVITSMSMNYDPQTTVGFHRDGSPVSIDLSLTFQEITFQISQDNAKARNLNLPDSVLQAQAQRDSNLASLGGQSTAATLRGGGLGGGNDSFR